MAKDTYEFVAELGDRFPDLTDQEVMDAVDEYEKREAGYTNPNSPIGHVLLACYAGKNVASGKRASEAMFGIDLTHA